MFNRDFYPTPSHIIYQMIHGLELKGKHVLEPSAGKGDIIDILNECGANVSFCETNQTLRAICSQKARLASNDFLSLRKEEMSHYDYIIANPPFSTQESHIFHMWENAPDGCEIISLCNASLMDNSYSYSRKSLKGIVTEYGTFQNLGNVFSDAERETDVSVGLIHLYKPKSNDAEFEGYFDMEEDSFQQENGVMPYDELTSIVQRYVGAVQKYNEVMEAASNINGLISGINGGKISFGCLYERSYKEHEFLNRDSFKKELQKSAWNVIFAKLNLNHMLTHSVREKLNKAIELQVNVPFTVKNIYKFLAMVYGTREDRMNGVIVDAFDKITKYYDENRFYHEGWKTNSQWRVNKKFILPRVIDCAFQGGKFQASYSSDGCVIDDLYKALCFVTGTKYDDNLSFYKFCQNYKPYSYAVNRFLTEEEEKEYIAQKKSLDYRSTYRNYGELYDWGFFKIRAYKKGTIHVEFKDEKVWDEFNRIACRAKGFQLAENYTSDFRKKSNDVVKV